MMPWMAWSIVIPLVGALLMLLTGRCARFTGTLAAAATTSAGWATALQVGRHGRLHHVVGGWQAPLGIELIADGLTAAMLVVVELVALCVTLYALGYFASAPWLARRFLSLWLFGWSALHALLLSADVFNFYVTLELLTLASVALMLLRVEPASLSAALRYVLFTLAGSLIYLLGVVLLYGAASTLALASLRERLAPGPSTWAALGLLTLGLSLKVGLFPLHGWLPHAYASAPPPVSALLSALIGKGAFYVLLRIWLNVFPNVLGTTAAQLLGMLGALGILWGGLMALRQQRLERLLAYSSVSQIGYFFLLLPLGTPSARAGGLYLVISHAAAKAAMFMAAGSIRQSVGHDELSGLPGLAHRLPFTFFAIALAGASLMGIPPSGGFVAKWLLVRSSLETGQWWWTLVLVAGGLVTAAYLFRVLRPAFAPLPEEQVSRPPKMMELVALALALVATWLGLIPHPLLSLLQREVTP